MRNSLPIAFALLPAALGAQQGPSQPRPQMRCAAYDSLMAGAPSSDPGSVADLGRNGARLISVTTPMRVSERDRGITGVSLNVRGERGVAPAQASIQVTVFLSEPEERPPEERQGALIVDDTLRIELGTMSESAGDPFPGGVKTWFLFGPVPRGHFVTLARAKKIDFKAGSSRHTLSTELVRNLRGALAAFVCRG